MLYKLVNSASVKVQLCMKHIVDTKWVLKFLYIPLPRPACAKAVNNSMRLVFTVIYFHFIFDKLSC